MIIPGSSDSDDFEFDDPDLEKLMSMVANWYTWRWVIGVATLITVIFIGSDVWNAFNKGFRPVGDGEIFRTHLTPFEWLQVGLQVAIPAMVGIAAIVSLRNPHNSLARTWFLFVLISICSELSLSVVVAGDSILQVWLDGLGILLCGVGIGCLYAERDYVRSSVEEADRRVEQLGYRD